MLAAKLTLLASGFAAIVWSEVTVTQIGPDGGTVLTIFSLAADPNHSGTLYAGGDGAGVFKSKDQGAHWTYSGLNGYTVYQLVADPRHSEVLYANAQAQGRSYTVGAGVFRTSDGGKNWEKLADVCLIGILGIERGDSHALYARGCEGILRSTDEGSSWQPLRNSGLPPMNNISTLALDPQNPGVLFAVNPRCGTPSACDTRIYRSTDGGDNWTEATATPIAGSDVRALGVDPIRPATLYARTQNPQGGSFQNGVAKSTDGGATWVRTSVNLGSGCCIGSLTVDPRGAVYASGFGGLFRTMDGGTNWDRIPYFPILSGLGIMAFDADTAYVVASILGTSGIHKSTDGGTNWQPASSSFPHALPVFCVTLDPKSVIYTCGNDSIYKSADGGASWSVGRRVPSTYPLLVVPEDADTLFAASLVIVPACFGSGCGDEDSISGEILKSTDGGATWNPAISGLPPVTSLALDGEHPGTLYAGTSGNGVLKSEDGGSSWIAVNQGLPAGSQPVITAVTVVPQDGGAVYAGTGSLDGRGVATLFKSTDRGVGWSAIAQSFSPAVNITAIAADGNSRAVYVATATYGISVGALWRTTDGGASWSNLLPASVWALAVDRQNPGTVYASTITGLVMTSDGGENWRDLPGAPAASLSLAIDPVKPNTVYAAGRGGLFAVTIEP